jgi:multiple sugar transport system substrate-binding protein
VLFYNKDLFDKFGVPYPKDGMTWADATDLAKKMTRQDGGVAYRGLLFDSVHRPASQLVLGYVDPKTLKATVNTEKWKRVYEMEKNVYDIPGNAYATGGLAMFMKDKTLAMFPTVNASDQMAATPDLNWDMVSYPSFPEAPGIGVNYDLHSMVITANSEHKDAAALVLSVLLSEGVQQNIAKNGRISVLKNDQLRSVFGQNLSYMKGKNIDAIFKSAPAANYPPTEFDTQARAVMNSDTANAVFKEHLDINTALQQADEAINKIVAENKTQ